MKKNTVVISISAALILSLAACSGAESTSEEAASSASSVAEESAVSLTEEEQEIYDSVYDPVLDIPLIDGEYELSDCLVLGEYKDLGLAREKAEVTDDEVEEQFNAMLPLEEVTGDDAEVQMGDTIGLDYEGTRDGEAFDGGTAEGAELVIGSNSFIEGFESGMVGMKIGEERDLALAFPDDYWNDELAGQAVNFHVKVNSISRPVEPTDEWASEYSEGEFSTVDELRAHIREDLEESAQDSIDYYLSTDIWQKVIDNTEFKALPASLVESGEQSFRDYHESNAEAYNMTLEEYLESSDMTVFEFDLRSEISGRQYAQEQILAEAIAAEEKIDENSDEYKLELDKLTEYYGMTKEELVEQYTEEAVEYSLLVAAVKDRLISYAE